MPASEVMSTEYLAGFFDGEGCVRITVRGKVRQVVLECMLVNTDIPILREVQTAFGGRLYTYPSKKSGWKPFSSLHWSGPQAADLLKKLRPFLRLKARQADLGLEFTAFMTLPKDQRCFSIKAPIPRMPNRVVMRRKPEILIQELEFKSRMHELNRKGNGHASRPSLSQV
jgi:hypothetical protein